jgi:hypothetical protein
MNQTRLKAIRDLLKHLVAELDAEIHSDTSTYTLDLDYSEVVDYLQTNDDDGDA